MASTVPQPLPGYRPLPGCYDEMIDGAGAPRPHWAHLADAFAELGVAELLRRWPRVFDQRRGVCQDFSHVGIACLRSLGLPARYVSGYLETDPPPGRAKLSGVDGSHPWLSVVVPDAGWLELDPTNDQLVSSHYIVSA